MSDQPTPETVPDSPAWRRALDWLLADRKRLMLGGGVVLASLLGAVVAAWLMTMLAGETLDVSVEIALTAYDEKDYDTARSVAEALARPNATLDDLSASAYVLGVTSAIKAERAWGADRKRLYLNASDHLEEGRDRGFPAGREAEGLFLLGKSLFLAKRFRQCRDPLLEAVMLDGTDKSEIHRMLALALIQETNPRWDASIGHWDAYLSDASIDPEARSVGRLRWAEALMHLGKLDEAGKALGEIEDDSLILADALLLAGRLEMARARAMTESADGAPDAVTSAKILRHHEEAIEKLHRAEAANTLVSQSGRRASYLIGRTFAAMGRSREAYQQLDRTRRAHAGTDEELAAELELADLARGTGDDQLAATAYLHVLELVGDADPFRNRWLSLNELRGRLLEAYQHYLDAGNFKLCLVLAHNLHPTVPAWRTLELLAQTHRAWGRSLLDHASQLPDEKAVVTAREGRRQLRIAGMAYGRLARLRFATEYYTTDLWDSADAFFLGRNYTSTIDTLREYLRHESRRRHPETLVKLGRSLFALGKYDEALEEFRKCVELHRSSPASYEARLVGAMVHLERNETDEARVLLEDNLFDELHPESIEYRRSAFLLGRMLHEQGNDWDAEAWLRWTVEWHPDTSEGLEARYLWARAKRRMADQAAATLADEPIESRRNDRKQEVHDFRVEAQLHYKAVGDRLLVKQQAHPLSRPERLLLRNAHFARAGILFDLGEHDNAIKAYSTAAKLYSSSPAALEAHVQMVRSYQALGKTAKARASLVLARNLLARLKTTANFTEESNHSAEQWEERLEWLGGLLQEA